MPNLTDHQRSRIIGMVEAGLQYAEVARRLGIHRSTVGRTVRRYGATGSTAELPRSGRPRVTTARDDQYIRTSHLRDRFHSATFTARNLPNAHRRISPQTVRSGGLQGVCHCAWHSRSYQQLKHLFKELLNN